MTITANYRLSQSLSVCLYKTCLSLRLAISRPSHQLLQRFVQPPGQPRQQRFYAKSERKTRKTGNLSRKEKGQGTLDSTSLNEPTAQNDMSEQTQSQSDEEDKSAPSVPDPMAPIKLRAYQEECIEAVLEAVDMGKKRLGISLATGGGKTVVFTQLASRIPEPNERATKTLILAHRKELVEQAAGHCRRAYPDKTVEIEMGPSHSSGKAEITIASIQSLSRNGRLAKFDPRDFKLVLVDEAHHIIAKSYVAVLRHFNLAKLPSKVSQSEGYTEEQEDNMSNDYNVAIQDAEESGESGETETYVPTLIGVSATFSRPDGLRLGNVIDEIVYHRDYLQMIKEKWLSDIKISNISVDLDLNQVNLTAYGDYNTKALSKVVDKEIINITVVRTWLKLAAPTRKSTLVFCVDVDHINDLMNEFRKYGVDARYVTANTRPEVRKETLDAFKKQEFPVLVNCGVFTEGTDIPGIDCILLCRPTRSQNLLAQMIGRGMRLAPGKKDCHLLDLSGSVAQEGIRTAHDLMGLDPDNLFSEKEKAADLDKNLEAQRIKELYSNGYGIDEDIEEKQLQARLALEKKMKSEVKEYFADDEHKQLALQVLTYNSIFDLVADFRNDYIFRKYSPHAWVNVGKDTWILTALDHAYLKLYRNPDNPEQFMVDWYGGINWKPQTLSHGRLETVVAGADTFASRKLPGAIINKTAAWRVGPPSKAQLILLNKLRGTPFDTSFDYDEQLALYKEVTGRDGPIVKKHFNANKLGPLGIFDLTKGMAGDMLTKYKHGAKGRFQEYQRQWKKTEKEVLKKMRGKALQTKVGPILEVESQTEAEIATATRREVQKMMYKKAMQEGGMLV